MEKQLLHFKEAALHGCITQASYYLGVSQPAISKSIKLLENKYQTTLIERHGRGIELTQSGQLLLDRVQRIERELISYQHDLNLLGSAHQSLRIGAGPAWEPLITYLLPKFILTYPNVKLSIKAGPICELIQPVLEGELDLALGGEDGALLVQNNELAFTPLTSAHLCLLVRANHPLANQEINELQPLTHFPWIAFQQSEGILNHINKLLERQGASQVNYVLETDFLDMAIKLVDESDFLLCISSQLAKHIKNPRLTTLNVNYSIWYYHLGIWERTQTQDNPLAVEFKRRVRKNAGLIRSPRS
ncbi:LysR family transcriptional regulator [Photobacterium satsumensis]|uniref:LysR family transcriptional regulator n=1 Tax=Photobacterium satsumensis TaxID=2910239 RepID=UPI003D127AED